MSLLFKKKQTGKNAGTDAEPRLNLGDEQGWRCCAYMEVCMLAKGEIKRERDVCEHGMFPVGFNN